MNIFFHFFKGQILNFRISESEYLNEEDKKHVILATSSNNDMKLAKLCLENNFELKPIQELQNIHDSSILFF